MKEIYKRLPRVAPPLLAMIVDYAGFGLVYPIVAALFSENGGLFSQVIGHHFFQGLAYLLYPLSLFFGAPLLGDLSDKFGRKRILCFSLGGIFLSYLLMAFSLSIASLSLFLIARALTGLLAGNQPIAQAVVADVSTESDKKWNMALISLANNIGLIFGPLVAALFTFNFFLERGGFLYPFAFVALFSLGTLIWLMASFEETFVPKKEKRIRWLQPVWIFLHAVKDREIRPLALILLLFQFSVALFYQMIGVYLTNQFDFSSSSTGFFYGFMGLFFIAGVTLVYPAAVRRFTLMKVIFYGLIFESLAIFFSILFPSLFSIYLFTALFALFNIHAWTGFLSFYSSHARKDEQGWAMGIFTGMVALGFMLAGWMTNLLPHVGSRALIAISALLSATAALFFLAIEKKH